MSNSRAKELTCNLGYKAGDLTRCDISVTVEFITDASKVYRRQNRTKAVQNPTKTVSVNINLFRNPMLTT